MTYKELESFLQENSKENGYTIQNGFIHFSKTSKQQFNPIPNFTLSELMTKNLLQSETILSIKLLHELHNIRQTYKEPIYINSSYRSKSYNLTIPGSASGSFHIKGMALDLSSKNTLDLQQHIINLYPNIYGIGLYNTFTHFDIRDVKTHWNKKKSKDVIQDFKDIINTDNKRSLVYLIPILIVLFLFFKKK